MFTRRQAIRWAELWLSCWNDSDYDTLLAMHREDARFGAWSPSPASVASYSRSAICRLASAVQSGSACACLAATCVGYGCPMSEHDRHRFASK